MYAQEGYFWHDWPIAIPMDYNGDNFTVPLSTLSTWVMVVLMFGCSLHWVRAYSVVLGDLAVFEVFPTKLWESAPVCSGVCVCVCVDRIMLGLIIPIIIIFIIFVIFIIVTTIINFFHLSRDS